MNNLPRKVAQLCQKDQNQLSSPLIIAERFHFFRFVICRPKALHYAAYIFVLYVLLAQTVVSAACSVESFLPPPSNILPNVHAVIPDLLDGRIVLIEQVYWNCALKFFDLSGDGISEVAQSLAPLSTNDQKVIENPTNRQPSGTPKRKLSWCEFHILLISGIGSLMLGFFLRGVLSWAGKAVWRIFKKGGTCE
jgi:hypothetical protein